MKRNPEGQQVTFVRLRGEVLRRVIAELSCVSPGKQNARIEGLTVIETKNSPLC